MSRGPSFKAGDRVIFRSNPLNRDAVARGQVKRVIVEDNSTTATATDSTTSATTSTTTTTANANFSSQAQKYVVKNLATGKESVVTVQEIVSRQ